MSSYPFLDNNGVNSLSSNIERNTKYKEAIDIIKQGENYNLANFMRLKRAEANTAASVSDAPPDLDAPLTEKLLGEEGKQIADQAEAMVAEKILQTYMSAYMAPIGTTDINYRLGAVTGIKNIYTEYIADENGVNFKKAYDKDNIITDKYGRVYTRSNFDTKFTTSYWSSIAGKEGTLSIPYVNLFFPPYINGGSVKNSVDWRNAVDAWQKDSVYGTEDANKVTMDLNTFKCSRGNFTYRAPAFKSINDNIQILQYLLEQSTGIVSTYLTEWDLSLYMQEGLFGKGIFSPSEASIISLLFRIEKDNPLADENNYYRDAASYAFGNVNAAVSKMPRLGESPNETIWIPNFYPLSSYWTPYWSTSDVYGLDGSVKQSPEDLARQKIIQRTGDLGTAYLPSFYFPDTSKKEYNYIDIDESLSFYQKVKLVDERNAALSGWSSWDNHTYSDILYADPSDGTSSLEMTLQQFGMNSLNIHEALDQLITLLAGDELRSYNIDAAVSTKENNAKGSKTSAKSNTMGDKLNSMKKQPYLGEKDCLEMANKNTEGHATAGGALSNMLEAPGKSGITSPANTAGIPQNNPPLFGGPHGKSLSPKVSQSYYQIDNYILRNQPRLDWDLSSHNTFNSDSGYCSGITGNKMGDFYHGYTDETGLLVYPDTETNRVNGPISQINDHFGATDQSPEYALHRLKNGYMRYEYAWAMLDEIVYEDIEEYSHGAGVSAYGGAGAGYAGGYSGSSTGETRFPSYIDGQYVTYTGKSGTKKVVYKEEFGENADKSYYSYLENKKRRVLKKLSDGTKYYEVTVTVEWRRAYYHRIEYRQYKRYKISATPNLRWFITKTKIQSWNTMNPWSRFLGSVLSIFRLSSRCLPMFSAFCSGTQEFNRLTIPGNDFGSGYNITAYNFATKQDMADGSSGNENYWKSFILSEYGRTGYLMFVRGDSTVNTIFECPVTVTDVTMTFKEYEEICGEKVERYRLGTIQYLGVDLANPTFFQGDLTDEGSSGETCQGIEDFIEGKDLKKHKRQTINAFDFMTEGGGSSTSSIDGAQAYGMSGKGILTYLPGVSNPNIVDVIVPTRQYLSADENLSNWDNIRLKDLKFPLGFFINASGGPTVTDDQVTVYDPTGIPSYKAVSMPARIRKAITTIGLRSTFYHSDGNTYYTEFSYSINLLLNQLLWQEGFLKQLKTFFLESVSFPVVRGLLDNYVDKSVIAASKSGINPDTKRPYTEETKFNYWIYKAQKLFPAEVVAQQVERQELEQALDTKIYAIRDRIEKLKPLALKGSAKNFTWKDMLQVYAEIKTIRDIMEESTFEEYMMAYLNVLYEYRKYFIDLRFNKIDGTMWIMRQLESILTTMVSQTAIQEPPPISQLEDMGSKNFYKVVFWEMNNSIADKNNALKTGIPLNEDRITTVYVKVEYTDKDQYDADQDRLRRGVQTEPTVVYIPENGKYAIKPSDGPYYLDSWERLDAINKRKWNQTQLAAQPSFPADQLKYVMDFDDFGSWYIQWGNEESKTPIQFNVPNGVCLNNATEVIRLTGGNYDTYTMFCAIKETNDFWKVRIPNDHWPRYHAYKSKVTLRKEKGIISTGYDLADMFTTLCGTMGYSLWPITEEQATFTMNDNESSDAFMNIMGTQLTQV